MSAFNLKENLFIFFFFFESNVLLHTLKNNQKINCQKYHIINNIQHNKQKQNKLNGTFNTKCMDVNKFQTNTKKQNTLLSKIYIKL